jgi:hypothetical protein
LHPKQQFQRLEKRYNPAETSKLSISIANKQEGEKSTPDVIAFKLIKRAYDSNTLDKLRDFLSVQG